MPDYADSIFNGQFFCNYVFSDKLLGCGKSDRASDKSYYSVTDYVHELGEVRQRLGLREVYLMGFSWGTMLACAYMLEKEPTGVKGLILCAPYLSSPLWDADQRENIAAMPDDVRKTIEEGERAGDYGDKYQAAMMEYYKKHVCSLSPWPAFLEEAFHNLNMDVYLTMWGPSEFTITGALKNVDLLPKLNQVKAPVLLTCGDHDEAGVKTVKTYQMAFPAASMAVFPSSSHLHQVERPELFLQVIRTFLREQYERENENESPTQISTQKKLGLYNVRVSRVDETASKLAIAFKHDKGLMADLCNSPLVHIRNQYLNST